MNYDDAVRYLLSLGRELAVPRQAAAQKFDLRNIQILAERLGHPERAAPCAHIAGTNGKGSTAAMLESILRLAGLQTGLYTSPHLARINERIRVNGIEISNFKFQIAFERVHALIEELLAHPEASGLAAHPTFFECLTAMAFVHFAHCCHSERSEESASALARKKQADPSSRQESPALGMTSWSGIAEGAEKSVRVDFAVYEVGMGGRLDATNVVVPEVAVITQIDFDHENYLGHSIEEIAAEKAGIIKPGAWVVSSAERPEARAVIARRCAEQRARLVEIDSANPLEFALALPGRHQIRNARAAITAARLLAERGFPLRDAHIARGLAEVRWPGRLEKIATQPDVYLDGAHNPAGARAVLDFWNDALAGRRIHLVFGAVRDKAVDEIAGILFPRAEKVYLTAPHQSRALSAEVLAGITRHLNARGEVVPEPGAALEAALAAAAPDDAVFVTGSLYLVGEVREILLRRREELGVRS
jgi:dihydrofolate synthase/folylpolyglutamate synthase